MIMKTRANTIILKIAAAIMLLAIPGLSPMEAEAQIHVPTHNRKPSEQDTLINSATKGLIESFGELSKTASKLSEAALKLIESQENKDNYDDRSYTPKTKPRQSKNVTPKRGKAEQEKTTRRKETKTSTPRRTQQYSYEEEEEEELIYSPADEPEEEEYEYEEEETPPPFNGVYISDESSNGSVSTTENSGDGELKSLWDLPQDGQDAGKYLWIPDSKIKSVEDVLNGRAVTQKQGKGTGEPDLTETAMWKGEEVPLAIPTKRLGRFDRKLYNWLIYPKGLWSLGLTANYGELSTDDSEFLSLIQDVDLKGKIYSIKPSVSYFLRNNTCLGLRLAFTKGEMGINSFKVDIDEDMSFNLHDIMYTSESYATAIFIQQYFGLTRRGRFAVFNEAELSYGSGSTHFIRPFDGEMRDTRTKTQSINLNYSPGISILIMKNAAFNLSFGVFGFHLKDEKQWENGEECGSRLTSGINFRFNIFNINFGVSVII